MAQGDNSKPMDVPEFVIVRVEQDEPGKEPKAPIYKPTFYVEKMQK